eukprot:scaffold2490_cov169-Amphora_coffeaeformis.AAC.2
MTSTTKYTFDSPTYEPPTGKKKHHRRVQSKDSEGGEDGDHLDGSGSLTYSAASSINSATGESTDSSFADIMRVLDVQDSKELATVIQKERAKHGRDERSVAAESQHSLAYSTDAESNMRSLATDAESALNGTRYLSTIPGQPSDQYSDVGRPHLPKDREESENDTAGATMGSDDLIFAPAEHTDSLKRRKERKKRERHGQDKTPRTKNTTKNTSPNSPVVVESRQGTPPTARPPRASETCESGEEEEVWYGKWWMFWCVR